MIQNFWDWIQNLCHLVLLNLTWKGLKVIVRSAVRLSVEFWMWAEEELSNRKPCR